MVLFPVYIIMIPILSSIFIYLIKHKHMHWFAFFSQALITILAIIYFNHFNPLSFAETTFTFGNYDRGIGISLANDNLSMSFVFLAIFSWWMVFLYTFRKGKTDHTMLFFLMYLQGVFLGFLQTNDLFNLFVFFELTTIIVTILIAFKKSGSVLRAALYYLLLNTSGVLAFLIGIIFIYNVFGTINMQSVAEMMVHYKDYNVIRFAFVLMLAGVSVKAALFPVFTWLPKAHGAAQAHISALLSGLIVKGGLYLFIRLNDMFSAANYNYSDFFFVIGVITAVVGIVLAITQLDIKQMLAYSTISQVGLIMVGISSSNAEVFGGGILHIFNHALFKILLFLGAGVVIKVYKTKYVTEIRGMMRTLPGVSIAMIIAMLSITGAPLLNGFISKSIIIYGFENTDIRYWILFISNIGTATLFVKMSQIFFGEKQISYLMKIPLQSTVLFTISLALIIFGNFYLPIGRGFFGIDFKAIEMYSFSAFFDYAVTIVLAFLTYYVLVRKDTKPVQTMRRFMVSFETANMLFIGYIVLLTTYFLLFILI